MGAYPSAELQSVYSTAPAYWARIMFKEAYCATEVWEKTHERISNAKKGARGVMVIVVGNGHGDTSSNPGRDWLDFT